VSVKSLQVKGPLEVDIVESKQRKRARERPRPPKIAANVGLVEMRTKGACHRTAKPFIEITEHNPGAGEFIVRDNLLIEEPADLPSLFEESSTEVHVENMHGTAAKANIRSEATTAFSSANNADVVVAVALYRKSRQDDVAVAPTLVQPVLAESEMKPKLLGDEARLVFFGRTPFNAHNFLKRNDIGIELAKNLDDAIRPNAPVHTTTLVNVISSYSENRSGLIHDNHSRRSGD